MLALLATLWLCLGHRSFFGLLGFIAIYPLIVLFKRLGGPALRGLWQRWALLLLFSPVLLSAFARVRSTFALYTLAIICTIVIAVQHRREFVLAALAGLGLMALH